MNCCCKALHFRCLRGVPVYVSDVYDSISVKYFGEKHCLWLVPLPSYRQSSALGISWLGESDWFQCNVREANWISGNRSCPWIFIKISYITNMGYILTRMVQYLQLDRCFSGKYSVCVLIEFHWNLLEETYF